MFSLGAVWLLMLLQVVTAILPDLIIKIAENLYSQEFIRKEKFKIQQSKIKNATSTNDLKSVDIFKVESAIAQFQLSETTSNITTNNDINNNEIESISSSTEFNMYNSITPNNESQSISI
jgi:hypothetical protein